VAIWGTNASRNADAVDELDEVDVESGATVRAWRCDVSDERQVDASFAAVVAELGYVNSCFASAGVTSDWSSFLDLTLDEWHRVLAVNLDGVFLTMRAAARHMVERQQGGSLVAIGSIASVHGQVRGSQYCASKGGVDAMMRGCAVELARYGIRANTVVPGSIATPMARPFHTSERFMEREIPRIPLRRVGQPDELAGIAVYLAGPDSSFHTGDTLVVDGGYSVY
jgi:NAD(P)-dependent dehydrogenase (short-subunit alcohol dehydrogenase family)